MNAPHSGPVNVANDSAMVAVQAEAVHGDVTVYQLEAGASPEETFELGVRVLRGGMARDARRYIREAVLNGYVTSRSCFYLLLALLSGRTVQQVPPEEITMLHRVRGAIAQRPGDEWAGAIRLIGRLMTSHPADGTAPDLEQGLKELTDTQRNDILEHLELLLHSSVKDDLWARAFDTARQDRYGDDRAGRVWKFFQPAPAEARVRPARPIATTTDTWIGSITATLLSLVAVGFIAGTAWQYHWAAALLPVLTIAGGGYASAYCGVEWHFRNERRRSKEGSPRLWPIPAAPRDGFADRIDRDFDHYFFRYAPRHVDRDFWLAQTAGTRRALRDEVITIYRESRINANRVTWLVRYLVSDVARRWEAGTLWAYRNELRVPVPTKALCVLGAVMAALGGAVLTWAGAHAEPLAVPAVAIVALAAVWFAARGWLRIVVEPRRYAADKVEEEVLLADRRAALGRWRDKLADRPDDREMAHWLDCDRKALMEEAMRHYKLTPHEVLAHAFIEAPSAPYKRARVRNGPWRYSTYKLLIFLLTEDGVRQMSVDFDFEDVVLRRRDRINYRYDAVSSVQVAETQQGEIRFALTLTNGDPIKVNVTGPPPETGIDEDARSVSQATLDTAGFGNTLHVLEGVAAEGKEWIHHERRRERAPLAHLTQAVDAFFR